MRITKIVKKVVAQSKWEPAHTSALWDGEAVANMADEFPILVSLLNEYLQARFHIKFYPRQDGIGKPALLIYNPSQDFALFNLLLDDVSAAKDKLQDTLLELRPENETHAKSLWEFKKISGTTGTVACRKCGREGNKNSRCHGCGNWIPGKPISTYEGSWAQEEEKRRKGEDVPPLPKHNRLPAEGPMRYPAGRSAATIPSDSYADGSAVFKPKVGGTYWSESLGTNVTMVAEKNGWFEDKEGRGWSWEGRRYGEQGGSDLSPAKAARRGKDVSASSLWEMKKAQVRPPTDKQLDYCYLILQRTKTAPADEYGQPLFETSFEEADKYIKANRGEKWPVDSDTSAGDWGGMPSRTAKIIPADGYADGGAPYTDEEMDLMEGKTGNDEDVCGCGHSRKAHYDDDRKTGCHASGSGTGFCSCQKFIGDDHVSRRRTVKVRFSDGNEITTGINGTKEEIQFYYEGNEFELDESKPAVRGVSVEFLA